MRRGIAKSEKNNGPKLTIPVRTRSPIEAFKMLRAGQPIDLAAGYYDEAGLVEPDFYFMDKLAKLHKLAEYKETMSRKKSDYDNLMVEYKNNQINEENAKKAEQQKNNNGGVPEPGESRRPPEVGST